VSNTLDTRIGTPTSGRALYVGQNGEMYISRKYAIYRSDDGGTTWRLDCFVPAIGWKPKVAVTRLSRRLLRTYIAALQVLDDGTRVAVACDGVYRAAPGETRMSRVFHVTRGSRPLNLALDGDRLLFGEYGSDYESSRVRIYVSEDRGKTFEVGFELPRGDVRHIHNILVDRHRDCYWVLAGDFGRQPGIASLSKDLQTLEWLDRGSWKVRATGAIVRPDCLIYGTDSDSERNYIVRMDKESGKVSKLLEVGGSSLYATTFGPVFAISTCVEPNPACHSRKCGLYVSRNGADWQRIVVHRKDRFHPHYFQFGTIVLPYTYNAEPQGMYSGQAVEDVDDKFCVVEFIEANCGQQSCSNPNVVAERTAHKQENGI